jgi:hypothetical protein
MTIMILTKGFFVRKILAASSILHIEHSFLGHVRLCCVGEPHFGGRILFPQFPNDVIWPEIVILE